MATNTVYRWGDEMMSICHRSLAALCLLVPSLAGATLLEFAPADTSVVPGSTFEVNIVATPESGELIGTYDFSIDYDPAILAFDSLTFRDSLNDDEFLCDLFACRGFSDSGGSLSIFEIASPLVPLSLLQDGFARVVLATIAFDAVAAGVSGLSFTGSILGQSPPFNLLGDEFAIPLPVFEPGTATITVAEAIPEPPASMLMLTGLLGLFARQRLRNTGTAVEHGDSRPA